MIRLLTGDCREVLKGLPDESVHCCVSSPPYYGLRSYLPSDHERKGDEIGLERVPDCLGWATGQPCGSCYVCSLVAVFREVKRVLHPSGVVFLNLGDSYAGSGAGGGGNRKGNEHGQHDAMAIIGRPGVPAGLKPKDLMLIPHRVALALQADGWYIRSEICWHKLSPMPESVTDRCTRSHEMVYMLAKASRYYCDMVAVQEPSSEGRDYAKENRPVGGRSHREDSTGPNARGGTGQYDRDWSAGDYGWKGNTRNLRDTWTLGPEPFTAKKLGLATDHFAVFPTELARRCIAMGTSERGCCSKCGNPYERIIAKPDMSERPTRATGAKMDTDAVHVSNGWADYPKSAGQAYQNWRNEHPDVTTGWRPTCKCNAETRPAVVLDPFFGSGTVGLVSDRLGRDCIGIDLNPAYTEMQRERITQGAPLFAEVTQ